MRKKPFKYLPRDTEQAQFSAARSFSTTAYVNSFGGNSETLSIFRFYTTKTMHGCHGPLARILYQGLF
jgi:hypothetical protein